MISPNFPIRKLERDGVCNPVLNVLNIAEVALSVWSGLNNPPRASSAKMLALLAELQHPNLRLQYDIYHMSRMQEDCAAFLRQHLDKIGHIQFADCPGRGEPGIGEVNFAQLFNFLAESNYAGWLGAEYNPLGRTSESLAWMKSALTNALPAL